jgi:uncharacterized protein (TIGR02118 family)
MIKVSVLYPYQDGVSFNMDYYCEKHMPMVSNRLGAACKGVLIDQGQAGIAPGTKPAFIAMGHLLFDSVEQFQAAFAAHAAEITGDIPNYTNVQPVIQISEIKR